MLVKKKKRFEQIFRQSSRHKGPDNNNFFLSNPPYPPLGPTPPPLPSCLFNIPNVPRINEFLENNVFNFDFSNGYVPPAPDLPPLRGFARHFFPNGPLTAKTLSNEGTNLAKTSSNLGTNTTQTMSGDHLIGELEKAIEKKAKGKNYP